MFFLVVDAGRWAIAVATSKAITTIDIMLKSLILACFSWFCNFFQAL